MPACPDAGGNDKRALIDTLDVEEPTAQTADDQVHEDDYPRQSDLTHSTRKLPLDSHARSGLRQGRLCRPTSRRHWETRSTTMRLLFVWSARFRDSW
jgi:hypothetical protein